MTSPPPRFLIVLAALLALAAPAGAAAQDAKTAFPHVTSVGDVAAAASTNPGRLHILATLGLDTADYFRGAFDDVPEGLDEVVIGPTLGLAVELFRGDSGLLRQAALTLGTQNGLADQVQPTDSQNSWWYESNTFLGLAARLSGDWLLGFTYSVYASPNDVSPTFQEGAVALRHAAPVLGLPLNPQLKVAVPLDREDVAFQTGAYGELSVAPAVRPLGEVVTVSFPLAVGVGVDDYYGPGSGSSVHGVAGIRAAFPLRVVPAAYGTWTFTVGGDVVIRDGDIRRLSTFDGDDSTVLIGRAALTIAY